MYINIQTLPPLCTLQCDQKTIMAPTIKIVWLVFLSDGFRMWSQIDNPVFSVALNFWNGEHFFTRLDLSLQTVHDPYFTNFTIFYLKVFSSRWDNPIILHGTIYGSSIIRHFNLHFPYSKLYPYVTAANFFYRSWRFPGKTPSLGVEFNHILLVTIMCINNYLAGYLNLGKSLSLSETHFSYL